MTHRRLSPLRLFVLMSLLISTVSLGAGWGSSAEASSNESTSCTIDLVTNTHTCGGISALRFILSPSGGKTVVTLKLDPRTSGFFQARFDVTYNAEPSGFTVNIGDSASNDGGAGDARTQSNDSELQIFARQFTLFGSDLTSNKVLRVIEGFAENGKTVSFTIGNNHVDWRTAAGATGVFDSPLIYALNGQPDGEGPINYDIYAAFNRVIGDPSRSGSGVSRVVITLITPQPPATGDGKAVIQYTGSRSGDFNDPATLSAVLLDTTTAPGVPISNSVLTFLIGQQACKASTDAQGRASCSLTPEVTAGDQPLRVEFSGDFVYAPAEVSDTFTVTREQSHLAITSPLVVSGASASVRAVLREDGAVPVAGRQVLFQAGVVSATAATGEDGTATAELALAAGEHTVTASFAEDGFYASASASQNLHVLPPQIAVLPQPNVAPAGSSQAITVQILDGDVPLSGEPFGFQVLSGPNAGITGICDTAGCASDSSGKVTFRYTGGPSAGRDTVRAWLDLNHNSVFDAGEAQATASLHWTVRHPTAIVVANPQGGDYHDPVRLSAVLLNTASAPGVPIAGALLSLTSEAGSCTTRTDTSGKASCFITPQTAAGSYAMSVSFAGDGRHLSAHADGMVVITREQTTLAITSSAALESGSVVVRAVLREDGSLPVAGRSVTFHAGGQTFSVTTDAAGVVTANLGLAGDEYTLEASFAGDSFYQPADDEVGRLLVYQRGQFVIWGGNAPDLATALPLGAVYTFWGAQWADQVKAGDFSANSSFKGYADDVFPASSTWRSRPADASHPPTSVPAYLGVILSTLIQKEGNVESGNIAGIGVLRVIDPAAYTGDPGHPATGVLLALLPPDPGSVSSGTPPGAPTGVSAAVGDGFAEVRWTLPANPGSGPVTGYIVTMSPGGLQFAVPAGEVSRTIPGLTFGTSYQFTVAAVGRVGSGPASQPSNAVTLLAVPSAPQAVSAVAANAAATITWSPPAADGGSPILDYVVESVPGGALVTVGSTVRTATLTGLDNGTSYTFVVRARNAVGLGAESTPSVAVLPASAPSAPTGLVASAASREATLYWTAPAADGGSALIGYRIVAAPGGISATVPGNRTFARITGLDDGVAYRFTMVATNVQGDSPPSIPSDEVIPFGLPDAPGAAQATQGNGTALVRWNAPSSDGGRPITGYTVIAEPGGLTAGAPAGETSRLITGLTNGTAYTFQVTATNLAGTGPPSALSEAITPWTVPGEPTGVQATEGDASAKVTWVAPATDGGSPISRYVVVSHPDNKQVVVDAGVHQATVTGLTNGTFYVFTVRAANAAGFGPQSLRSNFVQPAGVPSAPTNVLAVVASGGWGPGVASVTWTASSNNGSPVTSYTITVSPGGRVIPVIGTATAALVQNLAVGTAYTFSVTATNRVGTSPAAQSNSFVAATFPGAPTNVIAVEEGQNIRVTWTPPHNGFTPIQHYFVLISPFGLNAGRFVFGETPTLIIGKGGALGIPLAFAVQAHNAVGDGPFSAWSNTVTPSNPPGAPGNVKATVDADAAVRVTWTAAAANGAPITSYTVTSVPGGLTTTVNGTATSATMSGLTVGTTYTFTVTATNQKGPGPASAPSNPVTVTGTPPTAEIQTPVDGAEVTTLTQIIGTAKAGSFRDYILEIAPAGESTFTRIASGTAPVINGVLGTFDPTMLLNDLYTVRLTVFTISGVSVSTSVSYAVEGGPKIGNFTLSFTDLSVPVSGLPITVIRNYDSRDKKVGDFGVGWTLELRQGSYRNNRKPGLGWEIESGFLPCQQVREKLSHSTVVRLSDAEVYRFRLNLASPAATTGGCFADARFEFVDGPVPGATLAILGNTEVFYENGTNQVVDTDTLATFEPLRVRLTTRDGRIFDLELQKGVIRIQDLNGNNLVITSAGVSHSSGRSISFARDGAGRITSITDPMGKSFTYTYDAAGDLIVVTDRENQTTRFTYDGNHRMLSIQDPRGITPIRNEYDADGRLIRHIDAFGKEIEYTHDLAANQEIITDRLGHSRLLEYDDRGNVVREVDALGNETLRTFDARDNLLSESDPLGHTTTYTYDGDDNRTSVTDPEGNSTSYSYDNRGQLLTITDARGNVSTNTYDADSNPLKTRDALGHETLYTYDAAGNMLTRMDPLGCVTHSEYDAFGNLTKETNALGYATTYTYDANGNRLSETKTRTVTDVPETIRTTFDYDKLGRLVQTTYPDGSTVRVTYDAMDHRVATIDRLGREMRSEFDEMGHLVRLRFPDGLTDELSHDDEGRVISIRDRAGRLTSYTYDGLGRLLTTMYPDSTTNTDTYDAGGRLTATTNATGATTQYEYDAAGRQTKIIDPLSHVTETDYDANGNVTAVKDPNGQTTAYEYDDLNRRIRIVFPDGTEERITYDAMGRIVSRTDQAGRITRFTYDCLGQFLTVIDALGQVTSHTYDEIGSRVSQTDANGGTTTFEYDPMRYPRRRTLPGGDSETTTFDSEGNLIARTDFMGRSTGYTYDAYDRLTERRYQDGTRVMFTYTPMGQRASATDARGTTVYDYDVRDRRISAIKPDGRKLEYAYDGQGRRTRLTATVGADTLVTNYDYDTAGRLITVTDPLGRTYTHSYDANGNRVSLAQPNGSVTMYSYNALNRLGSLTTTHPGLGQMIQSYVFTLGPTGNRERITEHDGTVREYAYDELYRLTRETVHNALGVLSDDNFRYDPVGNRLERTLTNASGTVTTPSSYDNRDRLLSAGERSFGWDDNGNLVSRSEGTSYGWDFDQRLREVHSADGTVMEVAYDADGNRVEVKVTPPTGPPTLTRYLVDTTCTLCQVVAESDTAGRLTAYYVRGNDLLSVMRPDGAGGLATRFYHADGLGSVRRLTDEAGNPTDSYTYSAFGELVAHTGSDPQPFAFAGEPYDPNVGFYQNRARWLDPEAGRFVSPDPVLGKTSDPQSLHQYTYAHLDPVNRTDPSGLTSTAETTSVTNVQGTLNVIVRPRIQQHLPQILERVVCKSSVKALEKVLEAQDHHPIPKFLGGKEKQKLVTLSTPIHNSFHRALHDVLKHLDFPGGKGGRYGSAEYWSLFYKMVPGTEVVALAAVLGAAELIDQKCKLNGKLRNAVLENLDNFVGFP